MSKPRKRIFALIAVLALAGASAGVFAAFTDSQNAQQSVNTGNVTISITNDANTGHITDTWSNRAAGDTITRTFTVTNTSSSTYRSSP